MTDARAKAVIKYLEKAMRSRLQLLEDRMELGGLPFAKLEALILPPPTSYRMETIRDTYPRVEDTLRWDGSHGV